MKKVTFFLLGAAMCSNVLSQVSEAKTNANIPPTVANCCNAPGVVINIPPSNTIVFNTDNTLTLSQAITVSTAPAKVITGIRAELIYFEFVPEGEDCLACNKNSSTFGNFHKGIIATIPALGAGTHAMASNFLTPKAAGNFPVSLTITLPPVVRCCESVVRWCIRYEVSFDDCTVCTKVICYEKKRHTMLPTDNLLPNQSN